MVRKIREANHDNAQLTESLQAMNDSLQLKSARRPPRCCKRTALAHTNELLSAGAAAMRTCATPIGHRTGRRTVAHKIGTSLTALSGHIQLMAKIQL